MPPEMSLYSALDSLPHFRYRAWSWTRFLLLNLLEELLVLAQLGSDFPHRLIAEYCRGIYPRHFTTQTCKFLKLGFEIVQGILHTPGLVAVRQVALSGNIVRLLNQFAEIFHDRQKPISHT